jgi:hypothetical protein
MTRIAARVIHPLADGLLQDRSSSNTESIAVYPKHVAEAGEDALRIARAREERKWKTLIQRSHLPQ